MIALTETKEKNCLVGEMSRCHVRGARLQAEKAMRVLENRVEQGYHRLNARRAATRQLRDAIDGARKERLAAAELQRKLSAQLEAARARALSLLHASHAACLARDKARLPSSRLEIFKTSS